MACGLCSDFRKNSASFQWLEETRPGKRGAGFSLSRVPQPGRTVRRLFSFACVRSGIINGVEGATCFCSFGESVEGTAVAPNTEFVMQAGQCSEDFCFDHPVGAPFPLDDFKSGPCLNLLAVKRDP
jgi:hypothetical protein